MFVRVARFEGGDPSAFDRDLEVFREMLREVDKMPAALKSVKRVMSLVDRKTGTTIDLTFCETEADLQAADEALNSMSPPTDTSGKRTSVEMFEVGLDEKTG
jgi:hypothetical protein